MLAKKITPHLKKLAAIHPEIHRQFIPSDKEEKDEKSSFSDPLQEEKHTVVRGLIHKYENRVLVLLTLNCAAYCRFCTRRRKVSNVANGLISDKDLAGMVLYIKKHPEIREVIISGGDPLTVPVQLKKALLKFSRIPQIKIIRVSTRLHVSDPKRINKKVIDALKVVKKQPLYLMAHFEHPAEITPPTIAAVKRLQGASTMLLSQTVSLKGVNDSADTLYHLFTRLTEIGVKPYYLLRCDMVRGAEHFVVDFKKEKAIFTELRKRLSGIAAPLYVTDAPGGNGKVPVPLDFWGINEKEYIDFNGKKIAV